MKVALLVVPSVLAGLLALACSADTGPGTSTTGGVGSGGKSSTSFGGVNSGGTTNASGGAVATTGGTTSAGATTSGGTSGTSAGATSGGANGSGGSASTGGSGGSNVGGTSSGGATTSGGANGSGGASPGTGGATNSGGANNGGKSSTGGAGTAGSGGSTGGSGGGATSGGSGGQVGLPTGVTGLFPAPNGTNLCPDPPLRIRFASPPTLGTSGKIQVFSSSGSVVASVDMAAAGNVTDTIGGTTLNMQRPTFVDGNDAVIYLKSKALAYGQTYYVTVDSGAIRPPGGGTLAIAGNMAWRFSTASAAPSNLATLTVALDGAGQFCTVQGATDAVPANSTAAVRINVNSGIYHEIVRVKGKSNLTLHGQDRKQTIIRGFNNDKLNAGTANRPLVFFDATPGLIIENLTIHNTTPQDGSQAEALRLRCDRCVVRDTDILSLQDTLLWDGKIYANNCYIEGNVDYIWGGGIAYFNKCEIRTVGRSGVILQARNAVGAYGYVFVDSKLTADSAATSNVLARIDATAYPGSHVAFINCQMTNISAAGWTVTGGSAPSTLRFWEYQSTNASGAAINTGSRTDGATQITAEQAATMRDATTVFGGWTPPN